MIANFLRVSNEELESYLQDSSLLEVKLKAIYSDEANEEITDLDKAWGGILFILTGQGLKNLNHPLAKAIMGNNVIDNDQDLGEFLTPQEVKDVYQQIAAISNDDIKAKYNPVLMTQLDVYPGPRIWKGNNGLDYILTYFDVLKKTYATAAENNQAIITFIS